MNITHDTIVFKSRDPWIEAERSGEKANTVRALCGKDLLDFIGAKDELKTIRIVNAYDPKDSFEREITNISKLVIGRNPSCVVHIFSWNHEISK